MLEVTGIQTFYGEFQAIHGISLTVRDGELHAIFGPNGHGKSTLLKTICGLVRPADGSVIFDGTDITGMDCERIVELGMVYIAEDRHLFPEMSVQDNLRMGSYCKRARGNEKRNLDFVFDMFPRLASIRGRTASQLSGGEARMLAIGRGLMSDPRFIAIDEPSLGLAPILRTEVFSKIGEIRKAGKSVLIVEQSTVQISAMADYMYLLEDGRIVHEGKTVSEISDENVKRVFLGIN